MSGLDLISVPEGYDLRAFDVLDSSNMECHRMAEQGHAGNCWVVTETQSNGRGRRGREWVSEKGNLFTSLLYKIDCDLETASQLSFVTALAVRDVVADMLKSSGSVTCKWPNDILVGGRKISGILLESGSMGSGTPSHVIIGIGVNILHHPEQSQFPATNLCAESGHKQVELSQVMGLLVQSMAHWINRWQSHGFSLIRQQWIKNAQGLGQKIIVRLPNEEMQGKFIDLDDNGALILEFNGERRHITAGDVFFM